MPRYELKMYPDWALRQQASAISDVDAAVKDLMDGMAEIMYSNSGIGLAAPQVGILQRVIIADVGDGLVTLANPEILDRHGRARQEEGCLSLPDIQVAVDRSQSILIRGIDPSGNEIEREYEGLVARVLQHEIDHLNGVLIIDYATPTEKIGLKKKLKALKENYKKM